MLVGLTLPLYTAYFEVYNIGDKEYLSLFLCLVFIIMAYISDN